MGKHFDFRDAIRLFACHQKETFHRRTHPVDLPHFFPSSIALPERTSPAPPSSAFWSSSSIDRSARRDQCSSKTRLQAALSGIRVISKLFLRRAEEISFADDLAYLRRLGRADERTRTADLVSLRVIGRALQGSAHPSRVHLPSVASVLTG